MDDTKSCENCKYFFKHFYWYKTKLCNAPGGHCTAPRRLKYKLVPDDYVCNYWEPTDIKQELPDEDLKTVLSRTAKSIRDIAAILKTNGQVNNE